MKKLLFQAVSNWIKIINWISIFRSIFSIFVLNLCKMMKNIMLYGFFVIRSLKIKKIILYELLKTEFRTTQMVYELSETGWTTPYFTPWRNVCVCMFHTKIDIGKLFSCLFFFSHIFCSPCFVVRYWSEKQTYLERNRPKSNKLQ